MKTPEEAESLAREMVEIGRGAGRKTAALITDMNFPLGLAVGNALEVTEAANVLKGNGPEDLRRISVLLAARMYQLSFGVSEEESLSAAERVISDGSALKKLCGAVEAMGGDSKLITGEHEFPAAGARLEVYAESEGYITSVNCENIGKAASLTGAGRERLEDRLDYSAGIILNKKYGDYTEKGERLAVLYGAKERLRDAAQELLSAFEIGDDKPPESRLVYKIIC